MSIILCRTCGKHTDHKITTHKIQETKRMNWIRVSHICTKCSSVNKSDEKGRPKN